MHLGRLHPHNEIVFSEKELLADGQLLVTHETKCGVRGVKVQSPSLSQFIPHTAKCPAWIFHKLKLGSSGSSWNINLISAGRPFVRASRRPVDFVRTVCSFVGAPGADGAKWNKIWTISSFSSYKGSRTANRRSRTSFLLGTHSRFLKLPKESCVIKVWNQFEEKRGLGNTW